MSLNETKRKIKSFGVKRPPKDPLPDLISPHNLDVEDWTYFSRVQLAEMFNGLTVSVVSRDLSSLGFEPYNPIHRDDIWKFYVLQCWKRLNPNKARKSYLRELEYYESHNSEFEFLEHYVYAQGGSEKHCQFVVDRYIEAQQQRDRESMKSAAVSEG